MTGLRETIATPSGKAPYVRGLFATIADRYDLITRLLSYGQDRRWKRRLVALAGPLERRRALDLACGTGDLTFLLQHAGAFVVGLDLTPRMVQLAVAKSGSSAGQWQTGATSLGAADGPRSRTDLNSPGASRRQPAASGKPLFLVGDMIRLPFAAHSFDVVTTGYGLRNVPDLRRALVEIRRVLTPGGLLLSLDFNRPDSRAVRLAYHAYLTVTGSALGWALHRDPDTYRYIPESIRTYPGAAAVAGLLGEAGFEHARWHRVLGGLMAIHEARVPKSNTSR